MGSKKADVVIFSDVPTSWVQFLTSCQKIHRPTVDPLDGVISWYVFEPKWEWYSKLCNAINEVKLSR